MSRIRSIKPEFFRHEKLQELGPISMLFFSGLWTASDKNGVFPWKPKHLKLDILPFIDYDPALTLVCLEAEGFIIRFQVEGKEYGYIPTWKDHQRISGKESENEAKYPDPPGEAPGKQPGSTGEAPGKQPGSTGEAPGKQPGSTWEAPGKHLGTPQLPLEREREREKERIRTAREEIFEENQKPDPEPPQWPSGEYPRIILAEWEKLGDRVYQPGNLLLFMYTFGRDVAPFTKGHHSDDILAAIRNFGTIVGQEGFYWTSRIGIGGFFSKHLEKFLPKNFREDDFRIRDGPGFDSAEDIERRLAKIREGATT